jgi:hypothetical protein
MKPYKGYLIEIYPEIVKMASGFGVNVPGPTMTVWKCRLINAQTGAITVLRDGSSERDAIAEIERLIDPKSKVVEREYLANMIKSTKTHIQIEQDLIEKSSANIVKLTEELERLKAEYKAAGGEDEPEKS